MIAKPKPGEAATYPQSYIDLLAETDLRAALANSAAQTTQLINSIPAEKHNFQYAPGKWTIKEIIQHLIDTERIFAYRALRFSRKDATPLPSYEENHYAPNSNCNPRALADLANEYTLVRESSIVLYTYMTDEMLDFKGSASNIQYSARILGWVIAGHNLHHNRVLQERYLG